MSYQAVHQSDGIEVRDSNEVEILERRTGRQGCEASTGLCWFLSVVCLLWVVYFYAYGGLVQDHSHSTLHRLGDVLVEVIHPIDEVCKPGTFGDNSQLPFGYWKPSASHDILIPVYWTQSLDDIDNNIEYAFIIQHGNLRNANTYFCAALSSLQTLLQNDATSMSGLDTNSSESSSSSFAKKIIVVAPQFLLPKDTCWHPITREQLSVQPLTQLNRKQKQTKESSNTQLSQLPPYNHSSTDRRGLTAEEVALALAAEQHLRTSCGCFVYSSEGWKDGHAALNGKTLTETAERWYMTDIEFNSSTVHEQTYFQKLPTKTHLQTNAHARNTAANAPQTSPRNQSIDEFADRFGSSQSFHSYDVLNVLLARLQNPTYFPNLRAITLFGFSAGGQTLLRYAHWPVVHNHTQHVAQKRTGSFEHDATAPNASQVQVEFVIADPGTYLYLDNRRAWVGAHRNRSGINESSLFAVPDANWLYLHGESDRLWAPPASSTGALQVRWPWIGSDWNTPSSPTTGSAGRSTPSHLQSASMDEENDAPFVFHATTTESASPATTRPLSSQTSSDGVGSTSASLSLRPSTGPSMRPTIVTSLPVVAPNSCAAYDDWRYGLQRLQGYYACHFAGWTVQDIRRQLFAELPRRRMTLLIGLEDNVNCKLSSPHAQRATTAMSSTRLGGLLKGTRKKDVSMTVQSLGRRTSAPNEACEDHELATYCQAMLQGNDRVDRFDKYLDYLVDLAQHHATDNHTSDHETAVLIDKYSAAVTPTLYQQAPQFRAKTATPGKLYAITRPKTASGRLLRELMGMDSAKGHGIGQKGTEVLSNSDSDKVAAEDTDEGEETVVSYAYIAKVGHDPVAMLQAPPAQCILFRSLLRAMRRSTMLVPPEKAGSWIESMCSNI